LPVVAAGAELAIGGPGSEVISLLQSISDGEPPATPSDASLNSEHSEQSVEAPKLEAPPEAAAAAEAKSAVPTSPALEPIEQRAPVGAPVIGEFLTATADFMPPLDDPMHAIHMQTNTAVCQDAPRWQLGWLYTLGFAPDRADRLANVCEAAS
jgi:hypothetical protein